MYESSTTRENALYTLSMCANEVRVRNQLSTMRVTDPSMIQEQQKLIQSLTDTFKQSDEDLRHMSMSLEVLHKDMKEKQADVRACILELYQTYTSIRTLFNEPSDYEVVSKMGPVFDLQPMQSLRDLPVELESDSSLFDAFINAEPEAFIVDTSSAVNE